MPTSTSLAYCTPGNQCRLLKVPSSLRDKGWTSVVVQAKGGIGCFALGHFLVYPEVPAGLQTRQTSVGGHWLFEAEKQPSHVPALSTKQDSQVRVCARFAPADFTGAVVFGPSVFLDDGRYRVDFFVKAEATAETGAISRLDVCTGPDCRVCVERDLMAADFAGTNDYQKFSLVLDTEVELSNCQFRVFSYGKTPLYVDRIELTCER